MRGIANGIPDEAQTIAEHGATHRMLVNPGALGVALRDGREMTDVDGAKGDGHARSVGVSEAIARASTARSH
jgi:hypothetical protein